MGHRYGPNQKMPRFPPEPRPSSIGTSAPLQSESVPHFPRNPQIYFSIVQRKVLTPNDFPDLGTLAERLLDFQYYWESAAKRFEWKFNRQDLNDLLSKLNNAIGKIE